MSLQLWTQIAQIASPIIAAIAAVFAARSSAASSRAASTAERGQRYAADELARQRRPDLRVTFPLSDEYGQLTYSVTVRNVALENVARDVRVEVGRSMKRIPQTQFACDLIAPNSEASGSPYLHRVLMSGDLIQPGSAESTSAIMNARLHFSDELNLASWTQAFNISEYVERLHDGEVERSLRAEPLSAPQRVELRPVEPGALQRIAQSWQVLSGQARAVEK